MTRKDQAARNWANAQKSTGPKTAQGKAVVAKNARKHGVTGQLDPSSIAAWLAVILDTPELSATALIPRDEVGVKALMLAQAEVRLVRAEQALHDFEAGQETPSEIVTELRRFRDMILDELAVEPGTKREQRQAFSLIRRMVKVELEETAIGGKRHCLLKRYAREARAQRRKALQSWTAIQEHTRRVA
ncbi:MAG: hypothetical protein HRT60_12195 [Dinoroseobacter sp.]|nr:hypothetical protein [Dinoroseobacter sp.]